MRVAGSKFASSLDYSARKADNGETREALSAGMNPEAAATSSSAPMAPA